MATGQGVLGRWRGPNDQSLVGVLIARQAARQQQQKQRCRTEGFPNHTYLDCGRHCWTVCCSPPHKFCSCARTAGGSRVGPLSSKAACLPARQSWETQGKREAGRAMVDVAQ